jgi:hypothetical protein
MLGWKKTYAEDDWVDIQSPDGGTKIGFQLNDDYVPPVWPEVPQRQQQMLHMDFSVQCAEYMEMARKLCEDVKIVVTGGFTIERVIQFEQLGVPADIYGIGSSLLDNSSENGTNNDFTADIVRVEIAGEWRHIAKAGRKACDNPNLEAIF